MLQNTQFTTKDGHEKPVPASYTAVWVNIYTIFTHTHKYCVNIYLYTMWVNIYTIFAQYLHKYVLYLGK